MDAAIGAVGATGDLVELVPGKHCDRLAIVVTIAALHDRAEPWETMLGVGATALYPA